MLLGNKPGENQARGSKAAARKTRNSRKSQEAGRGSPAPLLLGPGPDKQRPSCLTSALTSHILKVIETPSWSTSNTILPRVLMLELQVTKQVISWITVSLKDRDLQQNRALVRWVGQQAGGGVLEVALLLQGPC